MIFLLTWSTESLPRLTHWATVHLTSSCQPRGWDRQQSVMPLLIRTFRHSSKWIKIITVYSCFCMRTAVCVCVCVRVHAPLTIKSSPHQRPNNWVSYIIFIPSKLFTHVPIINTMTHSVHNSFSFLALKFKACFFFNYHAFISWKIYDPHMYHGDFQMTYIIVTNFKLWCKL